MRTLNVELNLAKLSQKKIQLSQFDTRIVALETEIADLKVRRDKKALEVSNLETVIKAAQDSQTVSN